MNTDCTGSQGPKWTVVSEKKEEQEMSRCVKNCFHFHLNV